MKPFKEMPALIYNSLMLVLVTFVLVEAKVPMTYTVDGGDSRPVTSHQNLTICSGVYVDLSVCVPTARPGSLLSLKVKGQTMSSSQICVRVAERFSSSQPVIFSYDQEEFVFNVNVDACVVSRKRRSSTWWKCSPATSWMNDGSITGVNSGKSTSRFRYYVPPMPRGAPRSVTCAKIPGEEPGIRVLCDGDWIVFQRRSTGDVDFYRNWEQYVSGFGDVTGEHWLGLEHIHTLCPPSRPCRLRVELKDPQHQNGTLVWAEYSSFSLTGYSDNYRLSISGYDARSTVGYDALAYHDGMAFSTKDKDNDDSIGNCAINHHGAWWYRHCYESNLNGKYGVRDYTGSTWSSSQYIYATYTEMKIRVLG